MSPMRGKMIGAQAGRLRSNHLKSFKNLLDLGLRIADLSAIKSQIPNPKSEIVLTALPIL